MRSKWLKLMFDNDIVSSEEDGLVDRFRIRLGDDLSPTRDESSVGKDEMLSESGSLSNVFSVQALGEMTGLISFVEEASDGGSVISSLSSGRLSAIVPRCLCCSGFSRKGCG